jgi:hypothetical protein
MAFAAAPSLAVLARSHKALAVAALVAFVVLLAARVLAP